jgi:hypothetical protein
MRKIAKDHVLERALVFIYALQLPVARHTRANKAGSVSGVPFKVEELSRPHAPQDPSASRAPLLLQSPLKTVSQRKEGWWLA